MKSNQHKWILAGTLSNFGPVVPLRLFGAHECWPRKAKWPRPGRITVVAGPAVDFSDLPVDLAGRDHYQACADKVMEALAAIRLED